jgi:hypothetical protein
VTPTANTAFTAYHVLPVVSTEPLSVMLVTLSSVGVTSNTMDVRASAFVCPMPPHTCVPEEGVPKLAPVAISRYPLKLEGPARVSVVARPRAMPSCDDCVRQGGVRGGVRARGEQRRARAQRGAAAAAALPSPLRCAALRRRREAWCGARTPVTVNGAPARAVP